MDNDTTRILLRAELNGSGQQAVIAHTVTLSARFVFVRTTHRFAAGERIAPLRLSFPRLASVETEASVVEQRSALAPGEDEGVLLEFAFRSESERAEVAELLSRIGDEGNRTPSRTTPFRVLLVEDSTLIRDVVTRAISRQFKGRKQLIAMDHANDGPAAIQMLRETKYDLAIVDYILPNLGGVSVIEEIRRLPDAAIPVIAVSVGGEDARSATLESGADIFLDKPLMLTDLAMMLDRLLVAEPIATKKRVLLVDDSPFILELVSDALLDLGYDVACVTELDRLDEALAPRRPDLMLVDVQMPEAYGDDVASSLREDRGVETPIYLFSSLPDAELETRAQASEIEGFIPKRIGIEAIVERVRHILGDA